MLCAPNATGFPQVIPLAPPTMSTSHAAGGSMRRATGNWRILRYKSHLVGMRFRSERPRGTSHTCPRCGKEASTYRSPRAEHRGDRKSTRLNSSHDQISYAVFCLKKKNIISYHLPAASRLSRL